MIYTIFRNGAIVTEVKPNKNSELSQSKSTEDVIKLNFTLVDFVKFKIGDYIVFPKTSQLYVLNAFPKVTESPKENKYECIFQGGLHEFTKYKVFLNTAKVNGGSYRDYSFPLTGNAQTFLSFIVDNLNRNGGSYVAGVYAETDTITVNFNNWNVYQSIYTLSESLGFDWYLDGNVLNFDKRTEQTAYTFQVGRRLGLIKLTRSKIESASIETVVYGYGSTDNMPPRTADEGQTYDSPLLTENRLAFDGVDGESKLTKNVDLYGIRESVQEFDDIKPEFTGTVSAIDSESSLIFFDTSINFDINTQLLAGVFPKITFLTGKLIGLTFNIAYELETAQITMDIYSDESGDYPNELIHAEVGDTYKIFDLIMPAANIASAKIRLQAAVQSYIDASAVPLVYYSSKMESFLLEEQKIKLHIGDIIRIVSPAFELDGLFEINSLTQNIINKYEYTIKFGDIIPKGLLATLKISNFTTDQEIYNVNKSIVTNNQVTNIVGDEITWEELT